MIMLLRKLNEESVIVEQLGNNSFPLNSLHLFMDRG